MHVFSPDGRCFVLQAEDLLEDSEVLQGFRCPVAELFRTDPGGILDLILDLLGWVVRRDHLHGQIRGQVEKARRAIVQALARPVGPIGPPDSVRALSVEKPDSTTTRPRPVLRAYSLRTKSVLLVLKARWRQRHELEATLESQL
ncbi:hypothetical protein DYH09_35780, partial [bacterium CPR1]|nr:hypothetical protein [bacterium CPR1]